MYTQRGVRYPAAVSRDFHLGCLLGKGGFGSVTLLTHKITGSKYALKTITFNHQFVKMKAIKEATVLQRVDHPCIVQLLDWWVTDHHLFMLLEYMVGGDLAAALRSRGALSEHQTKLTLYQLGLAVEYLHDRTIIHRDIKPANILLKSDTDEETLVKLTDFGVSKIEEFDKSLKTYVGTRSYMAPEVLFNPGVEYTNKVDIWSLGVILWECLTGMRPKAYQTMCIECCPPVPDFAARMLAQDPSDRMSIREMLAQLWFQEEYVQSKVCELLAQCHEASQPDMPRELRECGNEEFYFVNPVPRMGDRLPSYSKQRDLLAESETSGEEDNLHSEGSSNQLYLDNDTSSLVSTCSTDALSEQTVSTVGSGSDSLYSCGDSDISTSISDDITSTSNSDITSSDSYAEVNCDFDSVSSTTASDENVTQIYHLEH